MTHESDERGLIDSTRQIVERARDLGYLDVVKLGEQMIAERETALAQWLTVNHTDPPATPGAPSAEEIVRALAADHAPIGENSLNCIACMLCGAAVETLPASHRADCPWRQAKEWVAQHEARP